MQIFLSFLEIFRGHVPRYFLFFSFFLLFYSFHSLFSMPSLLARAKNLKKSLKIEIFNSSIFPSSGSSLHGTWWLMVVALHGIGDWWFVADDGVWFILLTQTIFLIFSIGSSGSTPMA